MGKTSVVRMSVQGKRQTVDRSLTALVCPSDDHPRHALTDETVENTRPASATPEKPVGRRPKEGVRSHDPGDGTCRRTSPEKHLTPAP